MVEGPAGIHIGIEYGDAGRTEGLDRGSVALAAQDETADNRTNAGDEADEDAHPGTDEVPVYGVFDEENHAKKEGEPTHPSEKLHAHKPFPVDGCQGRGRCGGACRHLCLGLLKLN